MHGLQPSDRPSQGSTSKYTATQEWLVRLGLYAHVLCCGALTLILTGMLISDVGNCFRLGCSALLPMRVRAFWSPVEVPIHVHIGIDLFLLLVAVVALILGYNDLTERLREIRAWREFEAAMQRIRAGENVDNIARDLRRRRRG